MEILITENFIPMTEETLIFIRNNYNDIKMHYILNNILAYTDTTIGSLASVDEVENLLSREIADEIKIKLLSEIQEKISVVGRSYSNTIIVHILKNNLDESDLPTLYHNYKDYDLAVRYEIKAIAKKNFAQIVAEPQKVCRDLVIDLLKDTSINEISRVNLFIAIIKDISSDECKQYLEFLDQKEFAIIFEQNRRPKVPINPVNQKIMLALKETGFVNDFVEDKESKVYKQIRRRAVKKELSSL